MNKIMLIAVVISYLSALPLAYADYVPPESYFTVDVKDAKTGQYVETPITLNIVERFEGNLIREINLTLVDNPETIDMLWSVPNYEENTIVTISVMKPGYKEGDPFVYTITNESPTFGQIFDHTFILEQKDVEPIETKNISRIISFDNKEFKIDISTSSDVSEVHFDQPNKRLIFEVEEENQNGFIKITLPKALISGPFVVINDDVILRSHEISVDKDATTIALDYSTGSHQIEIEGSEVIPEFPALQSVIILALIVFVVFGIILAKKLPLFQYIRR